MNLRHHYRNLGSTGIQVSPLGLGTVKFGRNTDVKYPRPFELPTDAEISDLLTCARNLGINLLDTAPAYGTSEQRVGQAIAESRADWVICTKVGEQYDGHQSSFDFSPAAIRQSVETSLENIGTRFLDIVLIHCDENDAEVLSQDDTIYELRKLQSAGLISAIGASTKTVEGGLLAIEKLDLVMVAYNHEDQSQRPVVDAARDANKGILIKKALGSGYGATTAAQGLPVILTEKAVSSVIIGTLSTRHLTDNVRVTFN